MSNDYSANTLIGVELTRSNNEFIIKGTSIALPLEDGEPIEFSLQAGSAQESYCILKSYSGGEVGGHRDYYGHMIGYDEGHNHAPRCLSLADLNVAVEAVKRGLQVLGYDGEVQMFCFLACY